ncbi:eCIS core domain-containing protein [Streptomyces chartreusis]|uniref:eCIS core domain-containing protein n=1 Tax=Streptomyces chartreusis TaxID=1969 RepID=UPI003D92E838
MSSQTQDGHAEQSAEQRRRKRKERAAKSRTPEPKEIVSGAGQPLDPGVRRELEERLGHDLSRVRLHTGRDAGQLTELLGADAVAVGQDVFFAEGAFKPGTDEGRRLLAHELLHTVQNPHGLGTLRAGRELGAVSLPQEAIEREAEGAAQDVVREPEAGPETADVEQDQATPGWLRYATVDADRKRAEAMDPATLVDRLANSVVRSLRGDPEDLSQRTRKQLARLPEELLDGVLVRLENRLLGSEHDRVLDLVDEIEAYDDYAEDGLDREAHDAPEIEPDTAEEVRTERENALRDAEERTAQADRPRIAPGPEKEQGAEEGAVGSTPQNGGTQEHGSTPQGGGAPGKAPEQQAPVTQGSGAAGAPASGGSASREEQSSSSSAGSGGGAQPGEKESSGSASGGPGGKEKSGDSADKEKGGGGREQTERKAAAAASKEESAAKNRPGAAEAAVAGRQVKQQDKGGQQKPAGSPTAAGKDTQLPGKSSTLDGKRNQDLAPEEDTDEDPFGAGSESEVEVGGGEPSAWDVKLQPEDFVPQQDLDVSGVPTADGLDPSAPASSQTVPSLPAPPSTRAEQVQAERKAEDAEDEAAESEEEPTDTDMAEPESAVPETEGSPDMATGPGGLALEQAAASPTAAGTRDPKKGDDPKAGPVAAQTTVQEAPGRQESKSEGGSDAKEPAAKEEKGTAAAGDRAGAAPEKESQQATGGQSAQSDAGAKESAGGSPGAEQAGNGGSAGAGGQSSQDAQGSGGAARDVSEVGNGSTAPGTSGATNTQGSSSGSGAEPTSESPAPESRGEGSSPTESPAASAKSAPAPATAAAKSESAPSVKAAPEPKAETVSAPAAKTASGGSSRSGGGAGGAGGGGGAAPARGKGKKDSAPVPNLAGVSPEAGLSTASKLKPHKALQAMGGVGGAVDRSVGDDHKELAAAPPSMQRPAGAPQTLQGKPKTDAAAEYSQDKPQEAQAPEQENAEVEGAKEPEGQIEAEKAEEPSGWDTFKMALGFGIGKVASWLGFEVDAQELAAKFAGLPTKDEALKQAQAGNAPGVEMKGDAEQTAGEQDGHVDAKGQETVSTARDDSGRGMGEDQVYPNAPKEELSAQVPGAKGGEGGAVEGGGATGAVPPEAASEVAEHEQGPQFQAAFSDGQKSMSEGRQAKDRDFRDSQAKHKRQVDTEIATNTETQSGEREKAMGEVTAQREGWRRDQDEELKSLGDKKSERHDKVRKDVEDKEKQTDDNVEKEKDGSDKKIQDESDKAERDAEKQRDGATQESGNWISKAFDWIKQKVIEIKNAIVRVIRAARDAVVGFIKNFKETVERWINEARKGIVEAIKNLIKDLIEFAVAMVRAVIELAARIRKFITDLIAAAIALVNRLAEALKKAISDLLDAIGKLLSSILDILKKALLDAVKAIVDAVKAVLQFASRMLGALGEFMMIAVDFLSDPGGWLGGAKNSAVDGAKNHLFREVKSAVKEWFQSKIQEIIGIPKAILDKLIKGGIALEQIVKEAWDAIVPQLPLIIGEIVITKVIAKLIPGAGWVMAVIDAIRTAIGALGEILRAMGAVLDWLKAVRQGGAGILFAKAVAAGIVALLELAYEALISGIGKYVAKVGRRFKSLAAKLGGKGKGDKPGKGAGADGAEDKSGAKKPTQEDPARKPGTPGKPSTTTTTKPGQAKNGTPGKPKPPGADGKKPTPTTSKDKDGKPKDQDEKPDTKPTPTAKPKPKAEPPAKPKPEPTAKPKNTDARTSDKPRDDKDTGSSKPKDDRDTTGKPKGGDSKSPEKPKDPNKPKSADKDAPGKGKPDKDTDKPGKPGKPEDRRRPKDKHESKGPQKPKRSKHENRRPKDKDPEKERQNKRDQRKKDEDSKDSKDERLRKIVARIRPRVESMLRRGTGRQILRAALAAMRAWYRLTELSAGENERFQIEARLNPKEPVANGLEMETVELADAVDAMVGHVLNSQQVIAQSQRIGPAPGGGPAAARTRVVPQDVGAAPMLRNMMDNPMAHRQPETLQIEAGDPQHNSRLELTRTEQHGGGTTLSREGSDEKPSYRQESKALRDAEPNGALMGGHVLDALAGNRNLWQGNTVPNAQTLDQAVFTATLIGLIETGRTPFTMVPNIAAANASKLGGPHIAGLVTGLPLSGPAARFNKKDMVEQHGRDSYEVVGGQAAGRQTEWFLAARRASNRETYFDTSVGVSVSETVGKGFLKSPTIKKQGHPAPQIDELTKKFKGVPGWMVQKAYNLGGDKDMRVGPALWEKVGSEIRNKTELQPPSKASEEVLRRTAANLKLWADAKGLVYSPNDPKAKGKFLVEIYRELVKIVGIPADSAFESRLERGISV